MLIVDRYIAKHILATTGLVLLAFLGIDFFIQFVEEVTDIGKGDYHLLSAMVYVILSLPHDIYRLFPMTGLMGGLLGLGLLASNNELVVMRASAMSIMRISRAVVMVVICMVGLVTVLGEGVAPYAQYYGSQYKALLKSHGQAVVMRQGAWFRDGDYFIHIGQVISDDDVKDIMRYHFNDQHELLDVGYAREGHYRDGQWHVNGIRQSVLTFSGVETKYQEQTIWHMGLNPSILTISQQDADEMSLRRLFTMIRYKRENHAEYSGYSLAFWQRLLQPMTTCVMILLVIPFVFGPLRSATAGSRLLIGALIGFGFHIGNKFFGPLTIVYHMPPVLAALLPTVIFFAVGLWMLSRVR